MACKDMTRDMEEDMIEIPENAAFTSRQHNTFNELRIGDELTDFTIISEGKKFRCHGVIIAASCSMFRGAFQTCLKESTARQMELPDIPPNVVAIILEYIYKRTIRVPSDLLLATIKAANYLHLHELQNDCLQRTQRVLTPSNVFSWHRVAPQLNDEDLNERCSTLLVSSLPDVAESSEFCELSLAELNSYFYDLQYSDVDCDDKVDAVIKWIRHSPTSRYEYMQELVLLIDLMQCSIQCLEEAIQNHLDLMDEEIRLKFAENVAILSQQENSRVNRGKRILVVIAGETCWQVDESRNVKIFCRGIQFAGCNSVCQVPQGFLVTGGVGSDLCMMYVASSQSWTQLTSMLFDRHSHASIYMQGKAFIFGGIVCLRLSKSVQSLQLDGGEWVEEPALPVAVRYPAVAQINLNIFLLDTDTNHLFCLDPKTKVWRPMAKCPGLARRGTRMISVNGQLLAWGRGRRSCFYGTGACYTVATDSWVRCSRPFGDHFLGALICHENRIFLIGGAQTETVEEYNMFADKWDVCEWTFLNNMMDLHAVLVDGI